MGDCDTYILFFGDYTMWEEEVSIANWAVVEVEVSIAIWTVGEAR